MENSESIGAILRQARDERGLSIQAVNEATKITPQNLAALEEDRFDSFPNRVYARAFLRDYANFLELDSASLLGRYEDEWRKPADAEPMPVRRGGSAMKRVAYSLITLLIIAGVTAGLWFGYAAYGKKQRGLRAVPGSASETRSGDVAQLPRANVSSKDTPTTKPKPPQPKPVPPPVPDKLVLEVTALREVWCDIRTDGTSAVMGNLGPGTKTFEAKKRITIKVGQANAVQLKLNGVPEKPLGDRPIIGKREFVFTPPPAAAPGATQPGAPGAAAPGTTVPVTAPAAASPAATAPAAPAQPRH